MKKLAVFASGTGSNFEAIADACADGRLDAAVVLMVCDKPGAPVIAKAEARGIPTFVFSPKEYPSKEAFETEIVGLLDAAEVDLVCLAGYMRIVGDVLLRAYEGRIINIHPSLLPKYGGKGMYGDKVHQAVLDSGDTESGITIHYTNEHYDEGQIIVQYRCEVKPDDTFVTLANRVHALEYEYYPKVIERLLLE